MFRVDCEKPRLTAGNQLIDRGLVVLAGNETEVSVIQSALELLVIKQQELKLLGTPSPYHYGAEEVLDSIRQAIEIQDSPEALQALEVASTANA